MPEQFTLEEMTTIEEVHVFGLTLQQLRAMGTNPYPLMRLTSLYNKVLVENKALLDRYAKEQAEMAKEV